MTNQKTESLRNSLKWIKREEWSRITKRTWFWTLKTNGESKFFQRKSSLNTEIRTSNRRRRSSRTTSSETTSPPTKWSCYTKILWETSRSTSSRSFWDINKRSISTWRSTSGSKLPSTLSWSRASSTTLLTSSYSSSSPTQLSWDKNFTSTSLPSLTRKRHSTVC